ncbi:MAG TPA: FkbM family methyltransferase [Bryobacteraceae bacterium]|nr:FkbM family methyltransferase [Bryobacteraceae bacterium]
MMASANLEEHLDRLLGEDIAAAQQRERTSFDQAAHPYGGRIVLYGAGGLGQRTLAGLRSNGVEPLAFADRDPESWDGTVRGLPVFSPERAADRFGANSVFVITVWNPAVPGGIDAIRKELAQRGCRRVVPFVWLFWKYAESFLPYYLWDLPSRALETGEAVRQTFTLFGRRSRAEFLRNLELRLTGNFACLSRPAADPQYFPERLFRPAPDDCFVDCGAYDGDTLRGWAQWAGGCFRRAVAFEADPRNFSALEDAIAADERLRGRTDALQAAVGPRRSKVRFAASGLGSASVSESGDVEVGCVSLDETVLEQRPTYIKMDIEGAELDALQGASATMRRHNPLLAVCTYHTQDHLWRIPLKLQQLAPEARLALRPHCEDGFDVVCYAIPPHRAGSVSAEEAA